MNFLKHYYSRRLVLAALAFWIPIIGFATLANEILEGEALPGDGAILQFIHQHLSDSWDGLFLLFTRLGSAIGIVVLTAVVISVCLMRHARKQALIVGASVAGAALANLCIKLLFRRTRPSLWHSIVTEHSFSFPSGHAMASSALAFACIAICWRTRWRWPVVGVSAAFILLVGFSRLYFGVHYPSDVLAGWLASLAWVTTVCAVLDARVRQAFHTTLSRVRTTVSR